MALTSVNRTLKLVNYRSKVNTDSRAVVALDPHSCMRTHRTPLARPGPPPPYSAKTVYHSVTRAVSKRSTSYPLVSLTGIYDTRAKRYTPAFLVTLPDLGAGWLVGGRADSGRVILIAPLPLTGLGAPRFDRRSCPRAWPRTRPDPRSSSARPRPHHVRDRSRYPRWWLCERYGLRCHRVATPPRPLLTPPY